MKKNFKNILFAIIPTVGLAISLYLFIASYGKDFDGYGTSYYFEENYLIAVVCNLILCGYAVSRFFVVGNTAKRATQISISALVSLYTLGSFLKPLGKALRKGVEFDFAKYSTLLWIGLFCLAVAVYFVAALIEERKEN